MPGNPAYWLQVPPRETVVALSQLGKGIAPCKGACQELLFLLVDRTRTSSGSLLSSKLLTPLFVGVFKIISLFLRKDFLSRDDLKREELPKLFLKLSWSPHWTKPVRNLYRLWRTTRDQLSPRLPAS